MCAPVQTAAGPRYCFPVTFLRLRSGPLGDLPVKQRCLHQWPFSLPASPAGLECPCSCSGASSMSQELRLTNPGCGLQCSPSQPPRVPWPDHCYTLGWGRSKAEEPRCLGPLVQKVLCVAWCRGQAGLGSGSSLGQPCRGEPALPMSPTVTPALGRSTGTPVSKQQVISTLPRSTGLSHLWLVTQLGHAPHVSRHLNDLPSCAQTAVHVCSTPHASLRPRAGWAQAELRRPHKPTPKPGLLPAK